MIAATVDKFSKYLIFNDAPIISLQVMIDNVTSRILPSLYIPVKVILKLCGIEYIEQ